MHALPALRFLEQRTRTRTIRGHSLVRLDQLREIDGASMEWLARQPGRTPREQLGSNRRMLGVVRWQSADTIENRLARALCIRLTEIAVQRLVAGNLPQPVAETLEAVRTVCERILGQSGWNRIRHEIPTSPNNVLFGDPHYSRLWRAWRWLASSEEAAGRDWMAQQRLVATALFWAVVAGLCGDETIQVVECPCLPSPSTVSGEPGIYNPTCTGPQLESEGPHDRQRSIQSVILVYKAQLSALESSAMKEDAKIGGIGMIRRLSRCYPFERPLLFGEIKFASAAIEFVCKTPEIVANTALRINCLARIVGRVQIHKGRLQLAVEELDALPIAIVCGRRWRWFGRGGVEELDALPIAIVYLSLVSRPDATDRQEMQLEVASPERKSAITVQLNKFTNIQADAGRVLSGLQSKIKCWIELNGGPERKLDLSLRAENRLSGRNSDLRCLDLRCSDTLLKADDHAWERVPHPLAYGWRLADGSWMWAGVGNQGAWPKPSQLEREVVVHALGLLDESFTSSRSFEAGCQHALREHLISTGPSQKTILIIPDGIRFSQRRGMLAAVRSTIDKPTIIVPRSVCLGYWAGKTTQHAYLMVLDLDSPQPSITLLAAKSSGIQGIHWSIKHSKPLAAEDSSNEESVPLFGWNLVARSRCGLDRPPEDNKARLIRLWHRMRASPEARVRVSAMESKLADWTTAVVQELEQTLLYHGFHARGSEVALVINPPAVDAVGVESIILGVANAMARRLDTSLMPEVGSAIEGASICAERWKTGLALWEEESPRRALALTGTSTCIEQQLVANPVVRYGRPDEDSQCKPCCTVVLQKASQSPVVLVSTGAPGRGEDLFLAEFKGDCDAGDALIAAEYAPDSEAGFQLVLSQTGRRTLRKCGTLTVPTKPVPLPPVDDALKLGRSSRVERELKKWPENIPFNDVVLRLDAFHLVAEADRKDESSRLFAAVARSKWLILAEQSFIAPLARQARMYQMLRGLSIVAKVSSGVNRGPCPHLEELLNLLGFLAKHASDCVENLDAALRIVGKGKWASTKDAKRKSEQIVCNVLTQNNQTPAQDAYLLVVQARSLLEHQHEADKADLLKAVDTFDSSYRLIRNVDKYVRLANTVAVVAVWIRHQSPEALHKWWPQRLRFSWHIRRVEQLVGQLIGGVNARNSLEELLNDGMLASKGRSGHVGDFVWSQLVGMELSPFTPYFPEEGQVVVSQNCLR